MSNRRAAFRRDKREREKILKSKAPGADLLRERNKGWEEGKLLAICVGIEAMHDTFGWRKNKIHGFCDAVAHNSANCNKAVIRVAARPWQERLIERINDGDKPVMTVDNIFQKERYEERNRTYLACASIMMLTLFSEYNFSSNSKHTGRMDKVLDRYAVRFTDIVQDPAYYSGEKYAERIKEMTGMEVA